MLFDTHAHYDDARFNPDRDSLLRSMPASGVGRIVNVGCNAERSEASVALAHKYDFIYAAVGVHPQDVTNAELSFIGNLIESHKTVAQGGKIAAIGEIGLEYYGEYADKNIQRQTFENQLGLAAKHNLPVILHDREAHDDCISILRSFPGVRGVCHCFSGDVTVAKAFLDLGWFVSFTGSVTFKKSAALREALAYIPNDRLMVETDCPYLCPEPFRGKRCDSTHIGLILNTFAGVRGATREEVEDLTYANASKFFNIP